MNIGIINYSLGNIRSVYNACNIFTDKIVLINNHKDLSICDKVILPGVGNFEAVIKNIRQFDFYDSFIEFIQIYKKPILGICVGFQVFFEGSEESKNEGLHFFPGGLKKFDSKFISVPNIGWRKVNFEKNSSLSKNLNEDSEFYFLHSFYKPIVNKENSNKIGISNYHNDFIAYIEYENIFGVQFHPEKSQNTGLKIYENFLNL